MNVIVGDDGKARCAWSANDAEYRRYHDEEWGVALHGDHELFEKLALEAFQAGLSWLTILRRRPHLRRAFHNFDIHEVAAMTAIDTETLIQDARIIRNRAKINATITNAQVTQELIRDNPGALDALLWSFAPIAGAHEFSDSHRSHNQLPGDFGTQARLRPRPRPRPRNLADLQAVTAESTAMSAALKKLGYRFVGPTTMHALMQSCGMVDDHLDGCWRAH